ELFKKVVPYHCLGSIWSQRDKRGKEHLAPTVRATVAQFNSVANCVITTCLGDRSVTARARARVVEHWIEVARECRVLKNFSSLYAILSALQSNSIHRLKKTWEEVSRDSVRIFQKLSEIFSDENNYSLSRELLIKVRTVKAGTLEKLVEHLVPAFQGSDLSYVTIFLCTYRAFTTTQRVLDLLFQRYGCILPYSSVDGGPQDQLKNAVSSILGTWLDQYSEDFCQPPDFPCLKQLVAYVQLNMPGSDLERRARLLLAQLEHTELTKAEPEGEEIGQVPEAAVDFAVDRAQELSLVLELSLTLRLTPALLWPALALELLQELALMGALALELVLELWLEQARALNLVLTLALELELMPVLEPELTVAMELARTLVLELTLAMEPALALVLESQNY
ncbi:Ral guanine nucleotide dissociation stimulator, partial [Eschrichtius robustus]|nr:Ral guanine nucleotide dissociation stimulator [Eschrichtius robustus]